MMTPEELIKNKFNLSRYVKQNYPELDKRVITSQTEDQSYAEVLYRTLNPDTEICRNGEIKRFVNVTKGYGYCHKGCSCQSVDRSELCRQGKLNAKAATVEPEWKSDEERIAFIREQVELSDRNYTQAIGKYPNLLAWIDSFTSFANPSGLPEQVYLILNPNCTYMCDCDGKLSFMTIKDGYREFCSINCPVNAHHQSSVLSMVWDDRTKKEKTAILKKMQSTTMNRFGVDNAAKDPLVKAKMAETNMIRYGGIAPASSSEVNAKMQATMMENHGVAFPGQSPEIMDKVRQTNMARYGSTHTMDLARDAFKVQNDGLNPFQVPYVKELIKKTLIANLGVDHPLKSKEIRETMILNSLDRWGSEWPIGSDEIRQKVSATVEARYHRKSHMQKHFSDEVYALLNDKELFTETIKKTSLRDFARLHDLGYDTVRKYCAKYGIELEKSSYETAIKEELRSWGLNVKSGDWKIIKPKELDIVLYDHFLAIEFGGLYWHSQKVVDGEIVKGRYYHLEKMKLANAAGYRLITVFEDEWVNKAPIVLSRIRNILGLSEKGVGARKITIEPIDHLTADNFLYDYHIQGGGAPASIRYGGFYDGQLVAVMTFCKARSLVGHGGSHMELLRFCTDGKSYPGIGSKMLKRFIRDHNPEGIYTFADRRWSEGNFYERLGFEASVYGNPNYWYVDPKASLIKREHRYRFQKHKLIAQYGDAVGTMTEVEFMTKHLKYNRIWDCGQILYVMDCKKS